MLNWARRRLGMTPLEQTFLLYVVYREWQERHELVTLPVGMVNEMADRLLSSPHVRKLYVAELWLKARKSFGADYDPERMFAMLKDHVPPTKEKE